MSTKGLITLTVTEFTPWDAKTPAADAGNCCTATGELSTKSSKKITITNPGTSDFEITVYHHGKNTSLSFQVEAQKGGAGDYLSFIPLGIAFKEADGKSVDPTGVIEFPELKIKQGDDDDPRILTVNLSDVNEETTWDFFVMIQATSVTADGGGENLAIGIIDPRVRGSAKKGVGD